MLPARDSCPAASQGLVKALRSTTNQQLERNKSSSTRPSSSFLVATSPPNPFLSVQTDSTTAKAAWEKGTPTDTLHKQTDGQGTPLHQAGVSLKVEHIARHHNTRQTSSAGCRTTTEIFDAPFLPQAARKSLKSRCAALPLRHQDKKGLHQVSWAEKQLQPGACWGSNATAQDWNNRKGLWVNLPFSLWHKVAHKIAASHALVLAIFSNWPFMPLVAPRLEIGSGVPLIS